jgi:GH25 family lysozyme M1 (1,4-beta-N-acetylmuramidase)
MIEGIDVSYYQGPIDWAKVAAAGKKFAIIRSGDGTFLDPMFEPYIEGALGSGMSVPGIYHYMRFELEPEEQAEICVRRWDDAHNLGILPFFWLDFEDTDFKCTPWSRRIWFSNLLKELAGTFSFGTYTGLWWWTPYMGTYSGAGNLPLWIGQYPYGCLSDPTKAGFKPTLPPEWNAWNSYSIGWPSILESSVIISVTQQSSRCRMRSSSLWLMVSCHVSLLQPHLPC